MPKLRNIATLIKDMHTTHAPLKEGWDVFKVNGSGVLEIEAVTESNKFKGDDGLATKHVLEKALKGDPHAMRALLILMAEIAEPVIDEAIRRMPHEPDLHTPFSALIGHPAAGTASRAVL